MMRNTSIATIGASLALMSAASHAEIDHHHFTSDPYRKRPPSSQAALRLRAARKQAKRKKANAAKAQRNARKSRRNGSK